jgi:DNA polymerase-3 subunit beta
MTPMETSTQSALQLHCERERLLSAIQAADAVVPSNSTKPILTNLLLDAKDEHLEVVATDMQVGLRCLVREVQVRGQGQAVVQARQLSSILKESASASVTLSLEGRGDQRLLHIALADGDYQIPVIVGESFPHVSFFPADVHAVPVPGGRFEEMVRQTVFAMDKDRISAVLSGLLIVIGGGEMVVAATNGQIVGEAVERAEAFAGEPVQVVVPSMTISHLQRILGSTKPERVELAFAGKLVFIRLGMPGSLTVEITSRLVEGHFPPYRNAINVTTPATVVFQTGELASAVRRAALMTNNTSRGIVMSLEHDQAVFSNLNYTNGSARIPVACQYGGSPLKLGINAQYLSDVLRVYKSDKIALELSRGLIMREPGATFLIMPISLPS